MGNVAECMHVEGFMGCGEDAGRGFAGAGVVGGGVCGFDGTVGGTELLVVWEDGKGAGKEVWGWKRWGGGKG